MDTTRLATLIDCKLQILLLLSRMAEQQGNIVSSGDMTNLIKLLSAKQTVMDQLQKVERELDPFRDEEPEARRWLSDAARRRCQENVERCNQLLGEIMTMEQQCEQIMIHRRDDVAHQLQGVHSASEARRAYGNNLPAAPGRDYSSEG